VNHVIWSRLETQPDPINKRIDDLRDTTNRPFEAVNGRLDKMDGRFESVNRRIDGLEAKTDRQFELVNKRIRCASGQVGEVAIFNPDGFVNSGNSPARGPVGAANPQQILLTAFHRNEGVCTFIPATRLALRSITL
jgi:hypothetical protein